MRPNSRRDSYEDEDGDDASYGGGSAQKRAGNTAAGAGRKTGWEDEGSEAIIEPIPRGPPRGQRDGYAARWGLEALRPSGGIIIISPVRCTQIISVRIGGVFSS